MENILIPMFLLLVQLEAVILLKEIYCNGYTTHTKDHKVYCETKFDFITSLFVTMLLLIILRNS